MWHFQNVTDFSASLVARPIANPTMTPETELAWNFAVTLTVDPASAGSGTLSSAQAVTDSNGIATVQLTGTGSGMVQINATAPNATNSPLKIPVVVR